MSDLDNGIDAIRKLTRLIKPLEDVTAALDQVKSLENTIKENEASVKKLVAQRLAAETDTKNALNELDDVRITADKLKKDSTISAQLIVVKAQEEAVSIKDQAKTAGEAIIAKATADGASAKASLSAQLGELNKSIVAAQGELMAVQGLRDAAQVELEDINKKIDAAKKKVAALLE